MFELKCINIRIIVTAHLVILVVRDLVCHARHARQPHAAHVLHRLKALLVLDPPGHAHGRAPDPQQQVRQPRVLLLLDVGDVAHDDVDQGVLHQREEDEHRAPGHEHIDCLDKLLLINGLRHFHSNVAKFGSDLENKELQLWH